MRIFSTVLSGPRPGKTRYISVYYADDTEIMRFDSEAPNPSVEPRVPWMEQAWVEKQMPGYWNERTGVCQREAQINEGNLNKLSANYNQSDHGEPRALGVQSRPHSRTGPVAPGLVRVSTQGCRTRPPPSWVELAGILILFDFQFRFNHRG